MHMFTELAAEEAASLIQHGQTLGCSGFTLAGAPKAIPRALAQRANREHEQAFPFQVGVITGASAGKSLDGALAAADAISFRTPFQTDPVLRERINRNRCHFFDLHLGQVPNYVERGLLGPIDWAVIEACNVTPQGEITLTSSVGASPTFCKVAKRILIELNGYHPADIRGIHDITSIAPPPYTDVIPLRSCSDRIGAPTIKVDPDRIFGIVRTHEPDESGAFKGVDTASQNLGQKVAEFLLNELRSGAFPGGRLLPIQAGVGNVSNALIEAMVANDELPPFAMYSEVLQDSVIHAIENERITFGSSTSWRLGDAVLGDIYANLGFFRDKLVLRPQNISNHPEIIRRLGVIAINTALEVDLFGNVNSTHVLGSDIVNGIGGSGDFANNAYISIFCCPSVAKDGKISAIVPLVTHVDHSEHSVNVIITDQGIADLRGKDPRQRAECIIRNCAHPDYRNVLNEYLKRYGDGHIPFSLNAPFRLHANYRATGDMRLSEHRQLRKIHPIARRLPA